jgi:hypothetical protein
MRRRAGSPSSGTVDRWCWTPGACRHGIGRLLQQPMTVGPAVVNLMAA